MSPIVVGLIGIALLLFLLIIGSPVGVAMALVGFGGFALLVSPTAALFKLANTPFEVISNYNMAVVPLFILMAQIISVSGFGQSLYKTAHKWLGHLSGGLCMATIAACAVFSAVSASSIATAVTLGLVALPQMRKFGYDDSLATGSVAAGGSMGVLIPPSGILIMYGIISQESIAKLFMAGIVPGILEAVFYICTVFILCRINPGLGPRGKKAPCREKIESLTGIIEVVLLILFVLGGLFVGWFTPTEAGGVGAFGAIVISLFRKRLTVRKFRQAILQTVLTTGMVYFIIISAFLLNFFMAVSTIPAELANFAAGLPLSQNGIMLVILLIYLFLGCFLDAMAMVLLTIPIFLPVAKALGFDPIWFGIILVRVMEVAVITPPVGMNIFAISGVAKDVPIYAIYKGIIPFLAADIINILLLLFFPQIVLFLPGFMG
jgi:tripartite ATP-independent transporter DctM subunit